MNVPDFDACFEVLAKATLALGRPEDTGKHLWANLTGGTNIVNAALMEMAMLSGLIARLYYTFIANEYDRRYLQPPSDRKSEFDWREVSLSKTTFDEAYYAVLQTLAEVGDWYPGKELLNRLKNHVTAWRNFQDMNLQTFLNQFLNRMDGFGIEFDRQKGANKITEKGRTMLERMSSPLFQALVHRGQDVAPELVTT